MRICVAGAGLAGSLLAWRLAQRPGIRVDLLAGNDRGKDATGASGGAVRGYDALAGQRELAIASLAELLASPVLRRWGGYRQTGFVYLPGDSGGLADAVAELDRHLPGSAAVTTAGAAFAGQPAAGPDDAGPAWAGREDAPAVVERLAGSIVPGRLRDMVLADLAGRAGVTIDDAPLRYVRLSAAGPARVTSAAGVREYDRVVLAAGAWTPGLLRASGLPAAEYRTKIISYSVCPAGGWCPPPFAHDATGLYGKPAAGGLLLGVPTSRWDVPPGQPPADPRWQERARELAAALFPRLRLGPARTAVTAVDCYCDPPVLSLRPVPAGRAGVYTFTGGSGGAAKTALAASARAAAELAGPGSIGPAGPGGIGPAGPSDNIGPADTSRIP